jgi:hypothetical protein
LFVFNVSRDNGVPRLSGKTAVVVEVLDTHNDPPHIEVNPLFSKHGAAVVPESAAIGRVTALLTITDTDSGRNGFVTCNLDNGFFSLQKLELNEYKVRDGRVLRVSEFVVLIFVSDDQKSFMN